MRRVLVALVVTIAGAACNSVLGIPEVERLPPDASATSSGSCTNKEKTCGGRCVDLTSPVTGCAGTSCDPCKLDNAVAMCVNDACGVETCATGWGDCDLLPETGCEHKLGDQANCMGCGDSCRAGFVCEPTTGCACSNGDACGTSGSCTNGRCFCGATECLPGFVCFEGNCAPPGL